MAGASLDHMTGLILTLNTLKVLLCSWMYRTFSPLRLQNSEICVIFCLLTPFKCACGSKSILVEKDLPVDVDAGFLTVTDPNVIDKESYESVLPPFPFGFLSSHGWTTS